MIGIDDVMFVRMSAVLDDATQQRHLDGLGQAIDLRASNHRIGVVYDTVMVDADAKRRQQAAAILDARRDKLKTTTAGFAMITPSPVARGILRAVFWLAPPPYPWTIASTVDEGITWLGPRLPGLDVDRVSRQYRGAVRELAR